MENTKLNQSRGRKTIARASKIRKVEKKLTINRTRAISKLINQFFLNSFKPLAKEL